MFHNIHKVHSLPRFEGVENDFRVYRIRHKQIHICVLSNTFHLECAAPQHNCRTFVTVHNTYIDVAFLAIRMKNGGIDGAGNTAAMFGFNIILNIRSGCACVYIQFVEFWKHIRHICSFSTVHVHGMCCLAWLYILFGKNAIECLKYAAVY